MKRLEITGGNIDYKEYKKRSAKDSDYQTLIKDETLFTIGGEPVMYYGCLLYTSPSPRDATLSRMPSSA